MNKELFDLADRYEGNLLNYFCGMTPQESRKFNKMVKETKRKKRWKLHLKYKKEIFEAYQRDQSIREERNVLVYISIILFTLNCLF